MSYAALRTVVQTSRPPFLLLALSAVFLSLGIVCLDGISWDIATAGLITLAAVLGHIAVNMHNEYCDHKSKLDFVTTKTPFSGGSGALQQNQGAESLILWLSLISLGLACAIGFYFVVNSSMPFLLVALGIFSIGLVLLYTPFLNRFPLLCLLAPGFGFGGAITIGSYVVLTEQLSTNSVLLGVFMAMVANNLLLLNQVPDATSDKAHGRNHWVIRYGIRSAGSVYLLQWLIGLFILIWVFVSNPINPWLALALVPFLLGLIVGITFLTVDSASQLTHSTMAMNVICAVVTPALLGGALCVVV